MTDLKQERTQPGSGDGDGAGGQSERRSFAEWVLFVASISIVAGLFVLVSYLHLTGGNDTPVLIADASVSEMWREENTYYVPIDVSNDGDLTAQHVVVQAELTDGDRTETSEFTLPYLAGHAQDQGVAVFSLDPAAGELTVRIASFVKP